METASKIGAKTDRERDYISALSVFYTDPSKDHYLKQAAAYSDAMAKVYEKYPADLEAGRFTPCLCWPQIPRTILLTRQTRKLSQCSCPCSGSSRIIPASRITLFMRAILRNWPRWGLRRRAAMPRSRRRRRTRSTCLRTFCPAWPVARGYSGEFEIGRADREIRRHVHARHELHAMHFLLYAYLQTGQDEGARQIVEKSKQVLASASPSGDRECSSITASQVRSFLRCTT